MQDEMNKNTIWWRITPGAFWCTAISLIAFSVSRTSVWKPSTLVLVLLWIGLFLPNLYLTAFSLWHWKFRYRGSHPVAWAVAFPIFWAYAPALLYFSQHINPDRKGKNQYGNIGTSVLPCHVPGRYNTLRSVSFVLGSAMLVWASIASILLTGTYHILFKKIDQAISLNAGKVLTTGDVQALHLAHRMNEFYLVLLCVAAIAGAIGGILLYLSNNFRWRLKEKDE